jgi:hypothetical protein
MGFCSPRPRHLFPMFGTGVGCFVLEEALQHAGRKADRRGVIQSIQSFGSHGMALRVRGEQGAFFSPHPPSSLQARQKNFCSRVTVVSLLTEENDTRLDLVNGSRSQRSSNK